MKKLLQNENSYLVCRAIIFLKENDLSYLIFTNGNKRHNEYFIENLTNDLMTGNFNDTDDFNKLKSECRKKACPISLENVSEPVYIYAVKNETIMKNLGLVHIEEKESVPILYIDDKNIQLLKKKDVIY
ncbi:MAG: hypothetical protein ACLVKO_03450 [Dysgonomonas sp.]